MLLVKRIGFWAAWPALYFYLSLSERSRILIINNDRMLLVKGRWSWLFGDTSYGLAGGGIRRGEEPKSAAVRELAEELGLRAETEELHFLRKTQIRQQGLTYTAQLFALKIDQTTEFHRQSSEITEARWVAIAELDTLAVKPEVLIALQAWSQSTPLVQ